MRLEATKAIILARVSTKEQLKEEEGHYSIPAQLANMEEYAEEHGFDVIAKLHFAESAFRGKRAKFKQALKIVEREKEPIAILFDEVTRFTRRWNEIKKVEELRNKGKVELHFVSQRLVVHKNSRAYDIASWEQLIQFARTMSLFMGESVKRTFKHKLAEKQYPGCLATGYLKGGEHDPERASLIKGLFSLAEEDKYSAEELSRIMREKGLTTLGRNGGTPKPVTKSDILYMLHNRIYTGKKDWKNPETGERDTVYDFNVEPIISEKQFEKVQRILEKKAIRWSTRHADARPFKFRGLIKCGFCGLTLTPDDMKGAYKHKGPGEIPVFYRCSYSKKNKDPDWYKRFGDKHSGISVKKNGAVVHNCPQRWWREEEIEEEIKFALGMLHYKRSAFEELRNGLDKLFANHSKVNGERIKDLKADLEKRELIKSALIRNLAMEGDLDIKMDMQIEYKKVKREIGILEDRIQGWKNVEEINTDEFVDTLILCSDLVKNYDKLSDDKKRELVIMAFSSIVAMKGKAKIKGRMVGFPGTLSCCWNEPFDELAEEGADKLAQKLRKEQNLNKIKKSV